MHPSDATFEWTRLREVLAEPPSELGFRLICAVLDGWSSDDSKAATAFAMQSLAEWPDEVRRVEWPWCCAAVNGDWSPSWNCVRIIDLSKDGGHLGCKELDSAAFLSELDARNVTELKFGSYYGQDGRELDALIDQADKWTALRALTVPGYYFQHHEQLNDLLASPVIEQLRSLHFGIDHERPPDLAALARSFPDLRRLSICSGMRGELIDRLETLHARKLTELILDGDFHRGFAPAAVKRFAKLPLLEQLRSLSLGTVWTDQALRTLAASGKLNLHALVIRGEPIQDYFQTMNESRIGAPACRALVRSGALRDLESLRIQYQRVGDEIVDLVRATTPGKLRSLELLDVELTDEGAEVLADLPHLAGLTELNLLANPLTSRGVRALAASPHLQNLRSLVLGGNEYNPYYGYCHPHLLLDEAVFALLESRALDQLERLVLSHAKISSAGVAALVSAPKLARLQQLDLSFNPFGMEPTEVLQLANLPSLESLRLRCCRLEDRSLEALVNGHLPALQSLDVSYNSIGPRGATALASWPVLLRLRSLNLHDNVLGTEGLIALARLPKGELVEFDIEQDCWNSRSGFFADAAAKSIADSPYFSTVDAFWGGLVDEYHGCRYWHPFRADGMRMIHESRWRPQARWALSMSEHDPSVTEEQRQKHTSSKEGAQYVFNHDFRNHPPKETTQPPMEGYQVGLDDPANNEGDDED